MKDATKKPIDPVIAWLNVQVNEMIDRCDHEDGCVDNVRSAEISDPKQVEGYNQAREEGCCGSTDITVTHPETGRSFYIGCNFGH